MLQTPVLLIVFNRPHLVRQTFEEIRKAQPRQLFVACDGPRKDRAGEAELCAESRAIIRRVDWVCEVKTRFLEDNVGPAQALCSAIHWFFEQVPEGIVLEEDCLPHPDFFGYCEELLNRYRDNRKVLYINGFKRPVIQAQLEPEASYHFSAYPHCWGWAAWRRSVEGYSLRMQDYKARTFRKDLRRYFSRWRERHLWMYVFKLIKSTKVKNVWDNQLLFNVWRNHGLAITPRTNLISNIGFGPGAVNTTDPNSPNANLKTGKILPLVHPVRLEADVAADTLFYNKHIRFSYLQHLGMPVKRLAKRIGLLKNNM